MKQRISSVTFIVLGLLILISGIIGTNGFLPDSGRIVFGIICTVFGVWELLKGNAKKQKNQ